MSNLQYAYAIYLRDRNSTRKALRILAYVQLVDTFRMSDYGTRVENVYVLAA